MVTRQIHALVPSVQAKMDPTEAEARLQALYAIVPPAPRGTYPMYEEGLAILDDLRSMYKDLKTSHTNNNEASAAKDDMMDVVVDEAVVGGEKRVSAGAATKGKQRRR